MGWKLFALLNVLLTLWMLTHPEPHSYSLLGIVYFAIQVLVTIGLVLMAFEVNALPRKFWRGFAAAYFAYAFLVFTGNVCVVLYQRDPIDGEAALGYALYNFAISYGLWRYGGRPDHEDAREVAA